ncbi:MAG: hypothetical protein ACK5OX_07700 [Desertimonas sp.]
MPELFTLRAAPGGRPYDVADIINHLAHWLESRQLSPNAGDMVEDFITRAVAAIPELRDQLSAASQRWIQPTHPPVANTCSTVAG